MPISDLDPQIQAALSEYSKQYKAMLAIKFGGSSSYVSRQDWLKALNAQGFRLAGMEILLEAMSFTESDVTQIQKDAEAVYWCEVSGNVKS
jgi:hypothetical protein